MSEMRLIDANALQRKTVKVETAVEFNGRKRTCYFDSNVVPVEDIENTPTIDAVPVVRCRECKYSEPHKTPDGTLYCVAMDKYVPSDGFCNEGEKIDGGAQA